MSKTTTIVLVAMWLAIAVIGFKDINNAVDKDSGILTLLGMIIGGTTTFFASLFSPK